MIRELPYTAPPGVIDAIGALARTEDLAFSPNNRRLAIAGFARNRVTVFDIDIARSADGARVVLTGGAELVSAALQYPHGLDFVDDDTLITTNRGSGVAVFELPTGEADVPLHDVHPVVTWPAGSATLLDAPGSVSVGGLGENACEILVCNNAGHTLTRHVVERDTCVVRRSDVLLQRYLDIPDGVAVSPDRRWIAVSNHNTHNVLLYENSPRLNAETEPDGILRRVLYPHGLRFSADGRYLFVADAGAPHVHVYSQHHDDWRGVRPPVATVRIMDDAVFQRGRHNPEEGGPKGLAIDRSSSVLAVTSECQPLAFFDMAALVQHAERGDTAHEQRILDVRYELSLMRESQSARQQILEQARQNSSWSSLAAPLRRLRVYLRRRALLPPADDG